MELSSIAVLGAGTMGSGIAQLSAVAGYKTILFDINEESLQKAQARIGKNLDGAVNRAKLTEKQKEAALAKIEYTLDFQSLVADVIIEAVLERLDVKIDIFTKLEAINSSQSIFASNTSSIPITRIAAALKYPERVVGMHFFNPAHIMKLVEVISGAATKGSIAQRIKDLALEMGKVPVMAKDSPGFIVNRVARHYYVESLKAMEENICSFSSADALLRSSGFRMGPFELMDLIGVDTNFDVTSSMFRSFNYDSKFRPSRIQEQKVDAGYNGRKSGKGFYSYEA